MNPFRAPLSKMDMNAPVVQRSEFIAQSQGFEAKGAEMSNTFSCTPIPLDTTRQLLLISCISVRNSKNNCIIDHSDLKNLLILPTAGIPSKSNLAADSVDALLIGLALDETFKQHYDLWVILEEKGTHEKVRVPIHLDGCRFTYFSLDLMDATMCLVHQLVDVTDDTDMFVEEQEFLFSVMDIQDRVFLADHIPQPVHYVESKVILQPEDDLISSTDSIRGSASRNEGKDIEDLSVMLREELRIMNSLVNKYESRNNNTSIASSMTISSLI
jgi:hypothetical protein